MATEGDVIEEDGTSTKVKSQIPECTGLGTRHLQSLLLAMCIFTGYIIRVNISVAIVAMTNKNSTDTVFREWDLKDKNVVLSSFFVGYLIMNIPAGIIGNYINNKWLLSVTFSIASILALFTPYVVKSTGSWKSLVVLRTLQGLFQAFMLPITHGISAKWTPPHERSRLIGFILSGIPLGTMTALSVSGMIASSSVGWPYIFYFSGTLGLIWVIFWMILGANSPDVHPFISKAEKAYIDNTLADSCTEKKNRLKIPWTNILTSVPVWATVVTHTAHNWGFWLLLSEMPIFMKDVLKFDIKADGLLSSIPYLSMWLFQFPVMYIADIFNKKGVTSLTVSRKIWNSIGMWGGCISLIILGYLDNNAKAAVILYIIVVTVGCCCNAGFNINHMDLTPRYAGVVMGITNGFASTGGLGAPLMVNYIVPDETSVIQWRTVFYIGAAILGFGNLFFVIFGSGEVQSWNNKYAEQSYENEEMTEYIKHQTNYHGTDHRQNGLNTTAATKPTEIH